MFTLNNSSDIRIGERNIQTTKEKLVELGIAIIAEDTVEILAEPLNFPKTGVSE